VVGRQRLRLPTLRLVVVAVVQVPVSRLRGVVVVVIADRWQPIIIDGSVEYRSRFR